MHLSVVILAAGLGKRMKSDIPKVLHEVLGRPMLNHVIDAVKPLKAGKTIVVIGNKAEEVKGRFNDGNLTFVLQRKLLGTGDALAAAQKEIGRGTVLVLNGDGPLITTSTLKKLLSRHNRSGNALSFLSFREESMKGYGRIIRDETGKILRIVEDKHLSLRDRSNNEELNGGVYALERETLDHLKKVKKNRTSGEYYLTDLVELVARDGKKVQTYACPPEEIRGINSRSELHEVADILRKRVISRWMDKGVTFIDPETAMVHTTVSIGRDAVIYPNTFLEGKTRIGKKTLIYPGVRIVDSTLSNNVVIKDSSLIEMSRIMEGASVGPFAHLRPDSRIGRNAKIGNFVEVKKSIIGESSKASHLSYLGDATIGRNVNIGAGTITCNYDGKNKSRTVIRSDVFIGSDTQLVAPVEIGKGAYVAAGATVTRNVPSGALAISRTRQKNLSNWSSRQKQSRLSKRSMKTGSKAKKVDQKK